MSRPEVPTRKRYIGDAVYADFDGLGIVLTTEDGHSVTNRIVLEPEVWNALKKYVVALEEAIAAARGLDV